MRTTKTNPQRGLNHKIKSKIITKKNRLRDSKAIDYLMKKLIIFSGTVSIHTGGFPHFRSMQFRQANPILRSL